ISCRRPRVFLRAFAVIFVGVISSAPAGLAARRPPRIAALAGVESPTTQPELATGSLAGCLKKANATLGTQPRMAVPHPTSLVCEAVGAFHHPARQVISSVRGSR